MYFFCSQHLYTSINDTQKIYKRIQEATYFVYNWKLIRVHAHLMHHASPRARTMRLLYVTKTRYIWCDTAWIVNGLVYTCKIITIRKTICPQSHTYTHTNWWNNQRRPTCGKIQTARRRAIRLYNNDDDDDNNENRDVHWAKTMWNDVWWRTGKSTVWSSFFFVCLVHLNCTSDDVRVRAFQIKHKPVEEKKQSHARVAYACIFVWAIYVDYLGR